MSGNEPSRPFWRGLTFLLSIIKSSDTVKKLRYPMPVKTSGRDPWAQRASHTRSPSFPASIPPA